MLENDWVGGAQRKRRARLHGESFSPFCHSSLDDLSAVWGAHSSKEAVRSFSLTVVGLVSPFHNEFLFGSKVYSPPLMMKTNVNIACGVAAVKPK